MSATVALVQIISMASAQSVAVTRSPREAPRLTLTFEGTRAEHVSDRGLRIGITLPLNRAIELRQAMGEVLPAARSQDWRAEILELLELHRGETGADEDALEVAQRLSRFWREQHP